MLSLDATDLTDLAEGGLPIPAHLHLLSSFTKAEIWEMAKVLVPRKKDGPTKAAAPALSYWFFEKSRRQYHDELYRRLFQDKRNYLKIAQDTFQIHFGQKFDPNKLGSKWSILPSKTRRFFGTFERRAWDVDRATKTWGALPTLGHLMMTTYSPTRHASPAANDNFFRPRALVRDTITAPVDARFKERASSSPFGFLGARKKVTA